MVTPFHVNNELKYGLEINKVYNEDCLIGMQKIKDKSIDMILSQKPVELFEYLIKTYTNEGDMVLDNCMGSGTTAIACLNLNRNFIGFETDKRYIENINSRIQDFYREKSSIP